MARRNVTVLVTVLALAAGSLLAIQPMPAQAGELSGAQPGTAAWALARAKATDQEVAVDAEQAQRRDVSARPDGSFHMRLVTEA